MSPAAARLRELGEQLEGSKPTGEFITHDGGGRPHPPLTFVQIRSRVGDERQCESAFLRWCWAEAGDGLNPGDDIVAYRTATSSPPSLAELATAAIMAIHALRRGEEIA